MIRTSPNKVEARSSGRIAFVELDTHGSSYFFFSLRISSNQRMNKKEILESEKPECVFCSGKRRGIENEVLLLLKVWFIPSLSSLPK